MEALEARRLYSVSYRELSQASRHVLCQKCLSAVERNVVLEAVTGLFYLNAKNVLTPICIHFRDQLYTPNDNSYAWLYAKTVLRHVSVVRNVVVRPIALRLAFGSVVASLVYSTLSVRHPLRQLLTPYLLNTLATYHSVCECNFSFLSNFFPNYCGQDHTPLILELAAEEFATFDFPTALNFVKDVKSRGMDDPAVKDLPYTYADDAMLLWNALEKYVRNIVGLYYRTPGDLTTDQEVTSFIRALRVVCPKVAPLREYTLEPLISTIMGILWLLTALPSVWRGDLDEVLRYAPNMPLTLHTLHVAKDGLDYVTEADVLHALPRPEGMVRQIAFTDALQQAQEEAYKLNSNVRVFADSHAQDGFLAFLEDLKNVGEVMKMRMAEGGQEAVNRALLPENIPIAMPLL